MVLNWQYSQYSKTPVGSPVAYLGDKEGEGVLYGQCRARGCPIFGLPYMVVG